MYSFLPLTKLLSIYHSLGMQKLFSTSAIATIHKNVLLFPSHKHGKGVYHFTLTHPLFPMDYSNLLLLILDGIAHVEVGRISVLERQGDEAAIGLEGGNLMVFAMLGHIGPCA